MEMIDQLILLEKEANEFGFNWNDPMQIMQQIQSEQEEIKFHLEHHDPNKEALQEEIGDLLHAAFSLCIFCHFDPKQTLQKSIDKFAKRFASVKQIAQQQGLTNLKGYTFEDLMKIWDQAKRLKT